MAIEDRYQGIVQAARDVIARRGYHQASIREIARAAELSLAGLYHYVGGKDELLFLVLDRALDEPGPNLADTRHLARDLERGVQRGGGLEREDALPGLHLDPELAGLGVRHERDLDARGEGAVGDELARRRGGLELGPPDEAGEDLHGGLGRQHARV